MGCSNLCFEHILITDNLNVAVGLLA